MAIRINNAKDFAGRTYLTTATLENLFKSFELDGNTLALTMNVNGSDVVTSANLSALVNATNAEFITVTSNVINDNKLRTFLNTTSGSATPSKIVTTTASGNLEYALAKATEIPAAASDATDSDIPTVKAVKTYVDEHGISLTSTDSSVTITQGEGVTKNLATNLFIKKLATATTGYAASYQLQIGDGANGTAIGDTIDIVKDQFLKDVVLGYGTFVDADTAPTGWTTTKDDTKQAILKLTFNTNTNGDDTAEDTKDVYILVDEMFHDKAAGAGIDSDAMASNVVAVKIETATDALKVYTAKGTETDLIAATASGLVVANVQAAIDLAVEDEHAKMGAAVSAVEANVSTLQGSTSAAVDDINARVSTLQAETASAVTALEGDINALDTKVDNALATVDSNLGSAVAAVVASVSNAVVARTSAAVQMLEAEVTPTAGTGAEAAIYTATQTANNIVAVYDPSGIQIYPEISRSGETAPYTYSLKANYGSAQTSVEKWTVLYTVALADYAPATVTPGTVDYTAGTVTANTIAAGTGATAPAAPAGVTVGDLTYKQNA